MKKHYYWPILIFYIAFISCAPKRNTGKEIKTLWAQHVESVSNNNGAAAAELIDSATVNYYDQMLELIKKADSNTVALLRLDQKFLVLAIRHSITPNNIIQLDGKKLYVRLVQMGMLGDESIQDNIIDSIVVNGDKATAMMIDTVKDVQLPVHFSKEGDNWKLNFTLFYAKYGVRLWQFLMQEYGKTESELQEVLFESINGKKPDNSIWHPITNPL